MALSKERAALTKILSYLSKHKVSLVSHSRADLDSAASLIALHSLLPHSRIYLDKPRRDAHFLFESLKVPYSDGNPPDGPAMVVVDTHSKNLAGAESAFLVIDHHQKDLFPIKARHSIIRPSYSSCSELIYDLLGPSLSKNALFALSVGIASDTVLFKVASSETLLKFASMLSKSGRTMKDVLRFISSDVSPEERPLIIEALQSASWVFISDKVIAFSTTKVSPSSVAALLSNVSDLVFVAEESEGGTKVSARSSGIKSIALNSLMASLAKRCNGYGGGHANAAGAFVRVSPKEAFYHILLLLEPLIFKKEKGTKKNKQK
ncbi:MAG: DHH family phosphoesterase [Candidatus Anstonellales archaeon]